MIKALSDNGFPVGGTANSVSMIAHTQGWLHCDIPGTDASGAVKALMDDLYSEFVNCEMPNRVKLSTSCCEINCGGQADIAIVIQHTKPPKINHGATFCLLAPQQAAVLCERRYRDDLIFHGQGVYWLGFEGSRSIPPGAPLD